VFGGAGLLIVGVIVLILSFKLFEYVGASDIIVIQSPVSGHLTWYTTPGVKWQGFGHVTTYRKRSQFWFSAKPDQGTKADQSIKVRFNDGGHANLSGSLAWEMPVDDKHLTLVHTQYGSMEAVEKQLIRTVVERSVYMTGPLMSSKESSAERRNDLLQYIEDQIQNGVYKTQTTPTVQQDTMTGKDKTVNIVKIITDQHGNFVRTDASPLNAFGIRTFNPSLNEVTYDPEVEAQIKAQQQGTMDIQTAMVQARKAEQAAITAEKNGQVLAATARWEQEVIKVKEVTAAQQRKEVAALDADSAELTKRREILLGEGEGAHRRLVMEADGALDKKIAAVIEINKLYAQAIEKHDGSWTPNIVMGGNGSFAPGGAAMPLVDLLTARTAQQMGIDLTLEGAGKTKGKLK
jgi:regulator of protease activity HflC (stomatin/prohibitin superfamily)